MKTAEIKKQIKNIISEQNIKQLCQMFEVTNSQNDKSIPEIRGLIMDELEARNPKAFGTWMDTEDIDRIDYPKNFFN